MQKAGVEIALADQRKQHIQNLSYRLHFDIPESKAEPIKASMEISWEQSKVDQDLILDFKNPASHIKKLRIDGEKVLFRVENQHIIIRSSYFKKGKNQLQIDFIPGEQALNRNEDYLYTLFVPDKASTAIPCFDQPNLKARYALSLEIPAHWVAVSHCPVITKEEKDHRHLYTFEESLPISSYLFAFAVGDFQVESETIAGREMNLYHRETDSTIIAHNVQTIFDLHARSLDWLEDYTGITYPFKKFDFALIPAFQFGGMEHPGAIFYKARSLFLNTNATVDQKMSRNSLIAHETAHMWFGDLVTMDWFNDVWLKEVFANFMAAKMVNPNFPSIDHDLRFLQKHQPAAYGEDRSLGHHPIQQNLDNLNEASLLYGRIIYQKAPIVMKQLEALIGEVSFQEGMQEYLNSYSFGNATWDDLIEILDKRTEVDLHHWSAAWVKETGMPLVQANLDLEGGTIKNYQLSQLTQSSNEKYWQQKSVLIYGLNGEIEKIPIQIEGEKTLISSLSGKAQPDFILPNASEMAYGYFELDAHSQDWLLNWVHSLDSDFLKLVAWSSLWESMLRGKITPDLIMECILKGLPHEEDLLGLSSRLGYLETIFWGFTEESQRQSAYQTLGQTLWDLMQNHPAPDFKKAFYETFISIVHTEADQAKLLALWKEELWIEGFPLNESNFRKLAYEIALREMPSADSILSAQFDRTENPDRKAAMEFIMPALSKDPTERATFFTRLKSQKNRQKEPWVLTALGYLHHPIRAEQSLPYLKPSLELVQEIQQTGGIFFPKRWTSTILDGHSSVQAAEIVEAFLQNLPADYPPKLKNKILQSADMLMRKATVKQAATP